MKHIHILAIVGPSGSGKTSISLTMQSAGMKAIVSYTTRPMRQCETDGQEHYFVTEATADRLLSTQRPLAYTEIAGYRYFTLPSQILQTDYCTYVIDEYGLQLLRQRIEELNSENLTVQMVLHTAYVHRDEEQIASMVDAERMARDKERIQLDKSEYDIHIWNDATNIETLSNWSAGFGIAIKTVLQVNGHIDKPVELHTNEIEIHKMINLLNKQCYEAVE